MRPTTYKWLSCSMLFCLIVIFFCVDRYPAPRMLWVAMAGWSIGCALCMVMYPPKPDDAPSPAKPILANLPVGIRVIEYSIMGDHVGYMVIGAAEEVICVLPPSIQFPNKP